MCNVNSSNKSTKLWGVDNIYNYTESITHTCFGILDKNKVWFEEDNLGGPFIWVKTKEQFGFDFKKKEKNYIF